MIIVVVVVIVVVVSIDLSDYLSEGDFLLLLLFAGVGCQVQPVRF